MKLCEILIEVLGWLEGTGDIRGELGDGEGDGEERRKGNPGEVWQYGEENLVERVEGGEVEQTVAGAQMEKEETGEEQVGLEVL